MKTLAAFLALAMVASGCAATAENDAASSSEEALTSITALDRVTPNEVAKVFADQQKDSLAKFRAYHPSITVVDGSNVDQLSDLGPSLFSYDLQETVEGLLAVRASIPVGELAGLIEPWAQAKLAPYANAQGLFESPEEGLLLFYYAEVGAREAKANSLAKTPGGKSLGAIRAEWAEVESDRGNLDSAYLRPVVASGEPTLGQIKKTFHVPFQAEFTAWGNNAVDQFAAAEEGPNNLPSFDGLKSFLKSNAVQKRWLFQHTDSNWSTNVLIVLDDQNQLWGFQMGYSK
jgi:hypothetical protein